jgi:hypothetical protein
MILISYKIHIFMSQTSVDDDDLSYLNLMLQLNEFMLSLMYPPKKLKIYHKCFQILFLQLLKTHTEKNEQGVHKQVSTN